MRGAAGKKAVAKAIRDDVSIGAIARALDVVPDAVGLHPIDDLQFRIRVRTQSEGTRYFLVKVSEQL